MDQYKAKKMFCPPCGKEITPMKGETLATGSIYRIYKCPDHQIVLKTTKEVFSGQPELKKILEYLKK